MGFAEVGIHLESKQIEGLSHKLFQPGTFHLAARSMTWS